jgi:hypothetical protein
VLIVLIATIQVLTGFGAAESAEPNAADHVGPDSVMAGPESSVQTGSLTRNGVNVEFTLTPVEGSETAGPLEAGDLAEISFQITSADSGEPLRNTYPGVWVDIAKAWQAKDRSPAQCEDRVAMYRRST